MSHPSPHKEKKEKKRYRKRNVKFFWDLVWRIQEMFLTSCSQQWDIQIKPKYREEQYMKEIQFMKQYKRKILVNPNENETLENFPHFQQGI